jgi:uncharacterized repeat protein (TIGR03803 family)
LRKTGGFNLQRLLQTVSAIVLSGALVSIANAASFATLYKFDAETGKNPTGGLLADKNGALYGTVHFFGAGGGGAVFQLVPPAPGRTKWTENILYSFVGGSDGDAPAGGLVRSPDGNLFGVTVVGGSNDSGTIYMLSPSGGSWTESVIYSFPGSDGFPIGKLLLDEKGNLYGVTQQSVVRLAPPTNGQDAWTATTLYTFSAAGDGRGPTGGLLGDSSAIYGTARTGGSNDKGIVFRLTPPESGDVPWSETVLYAFNGADGDGPNSDLVAKGGTLFGTTAYGGAADRGTVFALKPPKAGHSEWRHSIIYSFTGPDGRLPYNGLTLGKDGTLYGTTVGGGVFGGYGHGTVFQLSPPAEGQKTWTESVLHSFDDKDGNSPGRVLLDKSGAIYGNAQYSAGKNTGNSFQILP